tara:strand:- start:1697 stop:3049 length:1353 start_codon:yes stop_codon:yes gene_type:complete
MFFGTMVSFAQLGEQQIIDGELPSSWSIYVEDLDGDGNLDILVSEEAESMVAWYKNLDGLGNFGEQQIITQNLEYTRYVSAADIDNDGDMDVLATSASNDLVVWFENLDGLGNFDTQQVISSALDLPKMVIAEDVDSDGDLDVIIASKLDGKVTWFENLDGLGSFGTEQIISSTSQIPASVYFTDIDGDGDGDVVSDRSSNGFPCWFENLDGLGNFGPQQEITQDTSGSIYTIADDVDGDGDMDVLNLEFGGETIAWYENEDGLGTFGPKQIITNEVNAPRQIFMADFDNDGDLDILYNTSEVVDPDYLAWKKNDGLGNFGVEQVISVNVEAPRGVFAADIDNDGDMDVFSTSIADHKIAWYENLTILGIEDNISLKITLYPNPARTILNIENTSNTSIEGIKLLDVLGRLVLQERNPSTQLDISNLPTGLLFVQIETDNGSFVKKVIKE